MAEQIDQQIFDSINKANNILVALPANPNGDAVGAGLALSSFLKKLDKQSELVCANQKLDQFSFLPEFNILKNQLETSQSFVVVLQTNNAQLDELSYEVKDSHVEIFLKPKTGQFSNEDISFKSAKFPFDLIVTLDSPSLEHLGELYEKNPDLFFETTIVNIDHHPSNEQYGEINYVDLTASSTAEILSGLIEDFEATLIDADMATNLLTGIVVETNSFQHVKTTPKTFLRASRLVAMGAKQQDIVRELYKTKRVSQLKLWGRALARIKELPELGLAYSLVSHSDLQKSGSSGDDIAGVMKELVANLAGRKIILLLAEIKPQEVVGYFYLHPVLKAQVIASTLGGRMLNGSLGTFIQKSTQLLTVEKDVLDKLQEIREQIAV